MNTQTDPRIEKLETSLMYSGVPRPEAVAISAAVKYALDSSNYARLYGTVSVDALNTFLDRIPE